jgi:3-dehydroquinate dehydratase-1
MSVRVGDVRLGDGPPKVIVPVVGATAAELEEQAAAVVAAAPDLVEWRLDLLAATEPETVVALGRALVAGLRGLPLLVTFRTAAEGGARDIDGDAYVALYRALVGAGLADLVDVEAFLPETVVREVVALAHAAGVVVVVSNHDTAATPPADELVRRLTRMRDLGADVLKVAVLAKDGGDVLALLEATWRARALGRPVITMAMGDVGVVSRVGGGVFGSAATFGRVGRASAPGQPEVAALRAALALVHGED